MTRSLLLLLLLAGAAPQPQYFRYQRPLAGPPAQPGQACVALAPDLFAHAAPGLSDLRLYRTESGSPVETPYLLDLAESVTVPQAEPAILNAGLSGGATVFDAEMPAGGYSDIELRLAARDFLAKVTVWGSRQAGQQTTKLGEWDIFDFSAQNLGRSTVLHLAPTDFPHLHFRIDRAIKPSGVQGIAILRAPRRTARYITVAESSQATVKDHASHFELELPAHIPIDRIVFVPDGAPAQFSRDASVTAVRTVQPPQPARAYDLESSLGFGNLLRVHSVHDGAKVDLERLEIATPSGGLPDAARIKVEVRNGDDAPVAWKSVRLEMLERDLCFDSVPGAAYTLYYGDGRLDPPQYDYSRLTSMQESAARASLAAELANPLFQPPPEPARPFTERHPVLLWLALLSMIALLAWVAYRTAKQMGAKPSE